MEIQVKYGVTSYGKIWTNFLANPIICRAGLYLSVYGEGGLKRNKVFWPEQLQKSTTFYRRKCRRKCKALCVCVCVCARARASMCWGWGQNQELLRVWLKSQLCALATPCPSPWRVRLLPFPIHVGAWRFFLQMCNQRGCGFKTTVRGGRSQGAKEPPAWSQKNQSKELGDTQPLPPLL